MLAIAPERVRLDRAEAGETPRRWPSSCPHCRTGGVRSVSANGVLGDPTGAVGRRGRRLLAAAVDDLDGNGDRLDPASRHRPGAIR